VSIDGRPFRILDVFAQAPLQGNPLAVVRVAEMPPAELRQAFARETNLSETTFVMEAPEADGSWPVAIHTPEFELPFAGHPVLGTAWAVREDAGGSDEVVLATGQGPVTVRFEGEGPGALAWLEAPRVRVVEESDPRRLAAALAIPSAALDMECFRPSLADVGPRFHVAALTERRHLARLKPDGAVLSALLAASDATGVLVVAPADEGEGQFAARMFFFAGGLREDPATGSAACCLAELLREQGWQGRVRVTQGVQMQRPSRLYLEIGEDSLQVGGRVFPVLEGRLGVLGGPAAAG
jgi:trans-2,3-dihydro-3-hydroxyanthranilate isomerase